RQLPVGIEAGCVGAEDHRERGDRAVVVDAAVEQRALLLGFLDAVADQMEEWLVGRGSDGFNIMFPYLPQGLFEFVDRVVPELQKRGIFRTEYEGRTLRENLGLPRPENQFFAG
ncbi:MAG: hypothetical protein ACK463_39990, partial [Bradyrhizobium sp.]